MAIELDKRKTTQELFEIHDRKAPPRHPHPSQSIEALPWLLDRIGLDESHPQYPLIVFCLESFDRFDSLTLHSESYHNGYHSIAMAIASRKSVNRAKNSPENDPLFLVEDLDAYNNLHATNLNLDDLDTALLIASFTHDIGDIAKWFDEDQGNPELIFHQTGDIYHYTANNTEQISELLSPILARNLINKDKLDPDQQAKFEDILNLTQHLIARTTFQMGDSEPYTPFAFSIRFFDQIGQAHFNQLRLRSIIGLATEQYLETIINSSELKSTFFTLDMNTTNLTDPIIALIKSIHESHLSKFLKFIVNTQVSPPDKQVSRKTKLSDDETELLEHYYLRIFENINPELLQLQPQFYLNFSELRGIQLTKQMYQYKRNRELSDNEAKEFLEEITTTWGLSTLNTSHIKKYGLNKIKHIDFINDLSKYQSLTPFF